MNQRDLQEQIEGLVMQHEALVNENAKLREALKEIVAWDDFDSNEQFISL